MKDTEKARFNMIEQQIRPWDVLDTRVLELLKKVHREQFVPPSLKEMSFFDMELPLGHGERMWTPKLEARAIQELKLSKKDHVLEVGTGSGYMTALLAGLAGQVTSVEIIAELSAMAKRNLAGRDNITLEVGDAAKGWGKEEEYDAIVLTGSIFLPPTAFQKSLKIGGRMFAIVGEAPVMHAQLIIRATQDTWTTKNIVEITVPPLQNAPQPEQFVF